jgi:hypothetical protein
MNLCSSPGSKLALTDLASGLTMWYSWMRATASSSLEKGAKHMMSICNFSSQRKTSNKKMYFFLLRKYETNIKTHRSELYKIVS